MAQNANRRAETYAKKSAQAKKKRSFKSNPFSQTAPPSQSGTSEMAPSAATCSVPAPRQDRNKPTYTYVMSDLKQTAIIAAVLFVTLIILSIVL